MMILNKLFYLPFLAMLITFASNSPETHIVEIKQMKFIPPVVHVNKGDTVVFINKGFVNHDATEANSGRWASPLLAPGESWSMPVNQSSHYYCSIHVVMKGEIVVE